MKSFITFCVCALVLYGIVLDWLPVYQDLIAKLPK